MTNNNWYFNKDNGLINAVLLIDLKKTFNIIDHEILLSKLELYVWYYSKSLRNYLSDRTQVTVLDNIHSDNLASFAPVFRLASKKG